MSYNFTRKSYYSTMCNIFEFTQDDYRLDVTPGKSFNSLEKLSSIKGEPDAGEKLVAKTNASFFGMDGKSGDIYSTFVDEGLYYRGANPYYPVLILWKDGRMTVEVNPNQSRHAYYQKNAEWAIGSAWTLILNGKVDYTFDKSTLIKVFGHPWQYHPRTMIGQRANGSIVMVVTDGRSTGSKGLNIEQESAIMQSLGCVTAVNFDGGGSSEMIVNDKIVNKLQGGYQRSIGTAFAVYKRASKVPVNPTPVQPSGDKAPEVKPTAPKVEVAKPEVKPGEPKTVVVTATSGLSTKAEPNANAKKLGAFNYGAKLEVLESNANKTYYKVNGCEGWGDMTSVWVAARYVKVTETYPIDKAPEVKPTPVAPKVEEDKNASVYIGKGTVSATKLNARSGPSTSSAVVAYYAKGDVVNIINRSDDCDWFNVSSTKLSKPHWVYADYVNASIGQSQPLTMRAKVNLNLRMGPSTKEKVLKVIPKDATVQLLDNGATWIKVRYLGYEGYCSKSYLK